MSKYPSLNHPMKVRLIKPRRDPWRYRVAQDLAIFDAFLSGVERVTIASTDREYAEKAIARVRKALNQPSVLPDNYRGNGTGDQILTNPRKDNDD